jgi:hypothetical protein
MFRTQDLVINALPKEHAAALRLCIWGTRICLRPTIHCGFPTLFTCWRWTWITCWQWTPCPFATCYGFTCLGATCPGFTAQCHIGTFPGPGCPAGSRLEPGDILTDLVNPATIVINDVADIRTLRTQLQDVMTQLDEFEKGGFDVGTSGDLDEQEKYLKQALEDVQARRKGSKSK